MKYKPYPAYKDSGIEWLGEIPEGWKATPIKYHAELKGRIGYRGYTTEDIVPEGEGAISLSPSNMKDGCVNFHNSTFLSWEKYNESPEIMVEVGDILLVKTGSTCGKSAHVVELPIPSTINPQIAVFKNLRIVPRFFFFFLSTESFRDEIVQSNSGGSIPTVSQESILNLKLPLPPLFTQKAIASFLDTETARIDTLIKEYEDLIALLKEKRQALISHAVTRGLSELVSKDDPEFGEWAKPVKFKDSGVEWLGEIPEGWSPEKLKYSLSANDGGAWGDDSKGDENDHIVLRSTEQNVDGSWNITEPAFRSLSTKEFYSTKLIVGDLLVTKSSGSTLHIGKTSLVTSEIESLGCSYSNFMQRLRTDESLVPRFIWYILNNTIAREQFNFLSNSTIGLSNLNSTIFNDLLISLPPLSTQKAIASFLDKNTAKIDTLVTETESAIELLKEHRSALITNAVTGKINVEGKS